MNDRELLRQRVSFLFFRGRNIIYYKSIDDRPRAQYMHVLRNLREDAKNLLQEFSENTVLDKEIIEMKVFLKSILSIIPVKVKTEECESIINKLERSLYVNQQEKERTA